MPSNDEKKPEQDSGKIVSFKAQKSDDKELKNGKAVAAKPKKHLSIGWWLGIIVLILISISFVLAPAIEALASKNQGTGLVFGTYGKEEIKFIQGNYFYDAYQNYANQYKSSNADSTQAIYQIWHSAYQSTVIYTAINQMAKKAGIIASDAVVNRKIIDSGYYNKDGKFDTATYQKATVEQKTTIENQVRRELPMQIIVGDISSVLSSDGEKSFVADMADNSRAFQYVSFDSASYPDELASQYALQNPQLFYSFDLSMITTASKEEAQAALDKINGGSTFEEVAASSSTDSYASAQGKVGTVYFFQLTSLFKNADDAQTLFAAAAGSTTGPIEGNGSWYLFKSASAPAAPDYTNANTLYLIKSYMTAYATDTIDAYLKDNADKFVAEVKTSTFEDVADKDGLTINDVSATPLNVGAYNYLGSFSSTDKVGLLTGIQTDGEKMKTLYTSETGTVTNPMKSGSSYLVAKVGDKGAAGTGSFLKNFYSYLTSSASQQDLSYSILTSEDFKDNFLSTFLTNILGTSSSSK